MQIGQRIKIAREAIGYTLERASAESGIGQSSLSEFENNKREPKFSHLYRLAEVYKKKIEFFLADKLVSSNTMLWREKPNVEGEKESTQAEFRQLCEQYHSLEVLADEVKEAELPKLDVSREVFDYREASLLAERFQREFLLGDIPSASLKQILEERFYVKIFHLAFHGSAISSLSESFGASILLNQDSKIWRRNFDLAHELFHLLTWNVFRGDGPEGDEPSEYEEKLANAFASRLLLPTDIVKNRIETVVRGGHQISFDALDEVAREFGVSLDALLWRMLYLYNKSVEEVERYLEQAKKVKIRRPSRRSDEPDKLPERYCSLAIKTLREGKLSLMQFAKYMDLSYQQARQYMEEDEDFTDEKISISVA